MVIERNEFIRRWRQLCVRFSRADDPEQAASYLGYLSGQMSTGEFIGAAKALWATAKWFPRPVDFLLVAAGNDWTLVLDAASKFSPPEWAWTAAWAEMSPRCQEAVRRMGGMDAVRRIWERDVVKLKTEWEKAYEQSAAAEIARALPPATVQALPR